MDCVKYCLNLWFVSCVIIGIASEDLVVAVSELEDDEPSPYESQNVKPIHPNFATVPQYNFQPTFRPVLPPHNLQLMKPLPIVPPRYTVYKPVQIYKPRLNPIEERKIKFVKLIKKKKKKKYKKLKKYLKHCGYPHHFKFKTTTHGDDDGNQYDTVKIGFMDDAYGHQPYQILKKNDSGNVTVTDNKEITSSSDDDYDDEAEDLDEEEDDAHSNVQSALLPRQLPPYFPNNPMFMHNPYPRPMLPPPGPLHLPGPPIYPPKFPPPRLIMGRPTPIEHGPVIGPKPLIRPPIGFPPPLIRINHFPSGFPYHRSDFNYKKPNMKSDYIPMKYADANTTPMPSDVNTKEPIVRIKPVQGIYGDNIEINTSDGVGQKPDQLPSITTTNTYDSIPYYTDFSPSYTAFTNPSTYNKRYSQPDYSSFESFNEYIEKSTTMQSEPEEKVVTVTPTSNWEGQPIYVVDPISTTTAITVQRKNTTRRNLRRLEETTTNSWIPLNITTQKTSSKFRKSSTSVTTAPVEKQQVNSPLSKSQQVVTNANVETQHEYSKSIDSADIITAKYPYNDINNFKLNMHNPRNGSLPILITKDNMDKYGFNKSMVYFNVADGIKMNERIDNKRNVSKNFKY